MHLEEGGRGGGGRGGGGSGLASGSRGRRCSLGRVLPGGRVCVLDEGSTMNRGSGRWGRGRDRTSVLKQQKANHRPSQMLEPWSSVLGRRISVFLHDDHY